MLGPSPGAGVNVCASAVTTSLVLLTVLLLVRPSRAEQPAGDDLGGLIATYFQTADGSERAALIGSIERAAGGSLAQVASAVEQTQLWDPMDKTEQVLSVAAGPGGQARLHVTLPPDYDAAKRYPMVLVLPGTSANGLDSFDRSWLDSLASNFVIAIPDDFSCADFNAPQQAATLPRAWLKALRRKYHLDTDRVYLYGSGRGGDAAFTLAVMHSDAFAAVIIREGVLDVPYRRELRPLLLENLRHTPTHVVWTQPDLRVNTLLPEREVRIALTSLFALRSARSMELPISETVLSEGRSADTAALARLCEQVRRCDVTEVSHRFRYPAQGQARFLRQGRLVPPVWEGNQIDIVVRPHVSQSTYITSVLESKLAYLYGKIEDQTITVNSRKCEIVELRIGLGLVDLTKPVLIKYNGKRRFEGRLPASISTLLTSAYEEWEFQHPPCVRLRIGKKGRILPF